MASYPFSLHHCSRYGDVALIVEHMIGQPGMALGASTFLEILDSCAAVRPAMLSAANRRLQTLAAEAAGRNGTDVADELRVLEQIEKDQNAAWLAMRCVWIVLFSTVAPTIVLAHWL